MYLSQIDVLQMHSDVLECLDIYPTNPFKFISDFFGFIFKEKSNNLLQGFIDQIIRLFCKDLLCYRLNNNRVIEISESWYPLFKNSKSNQSNNELHEQIFLNILHMPNKDSIETLGFG